MMAKEDINSANGRDEVGISDANVSSLVWFASPSKMTYLRRVKRSEYVEN